MKPKKFEIKISILCMLLSAVAAATMLLGGIKVHQVNNCIQEQMDLAQKRKECEEQGRKLAEASDYLTNEVYHFIVTQDTGHMQNYWNEINVAQNREKAVQALKEMSIPPEELSMADAAKEESDRLAEGEAWAMRLMAEALDLETDGLPQGVAKVQLSQQEKSLDPQQKRQLALDYIFGKQYTDSKAAISANLTNFQQRLQERMDGEMEEAVRRTREALNSSMLCNAAMLFYVILTVILFQILAMRPFRRYAQALQRLDEKDFTPLIPTGSRETKEFAKAFNHIYSDWETKKAQLEEERFRFHVAVENSHVVIYEYLPHTDTYIAYGTLNIPGLADHGSSHGGERTIQEFFRSYAKRVLDQDNLEIIRNLLEHNEGSAELQIDAGQGNRIWIRVTATLLYGENHTVSKIIGKIMNIESEKENELALADTRSRDGLTKLYNREIGLRKIQKIMQEKSPKEDCTLMLVDMDDFARVNQAEGSVFADAVLQEVAEILRAGTGPEDILVRLGGDEFLIFVRQCSKSRAIILGPGIAEKIRGISPQNMHGTQVSASIGMCSTEVVDEYSGLYRCAESTLNYVKSNEKGYAACYLDTSNELGTLLTQLYTDRYPINQIDRPDNSSEDLISFSLELLEKSKNLEDALALLLARMGRQYHLDRTSLLEVNTEYLSCHIACQWVRSKKDNRTGETYYITQEELDYILAGYDGDGLCDRYYAGSSFMKSILHAAIWDRGIYKGSLSFERRQPDYPWSGEERQLLAELTRIVSSFVLKAKADALSQAKTDFLSRMSHEIRTPMNAITGMTAIAKTVLDDPRRAMDCLNKIESANSYLLSLINDILDMSRIESGKMELSESPLNLSDLIQNLEILIRPQVMEKQLNFQVKDNFEGSVYVLADELHLNQILINLLGNAVKFTPQGGSVTLFAELVSQEGQDITVRFSVRDTGIGISQEAQGRIFNAFEQADSNTVSNYGGTGLGLSISTRLVQLMGGSLQVDSTPGKGSDFHFTLCFPKTARQEAAPQQEETIESAEYNPVGKRILLAEDNSLNSEIAVEILTMNGFLTETAVNGQEAVEQFRSSPPGWYDAVLMDIRMPVMDGMEAARRIRTMGKPDSRKIPIIAMTANAFDEDMKKSLENGMNGHLTKPIEVEKLLEMLKRCIVDGMSAG